VVRVLGIDVARFELGSQRFRAADVRNPAPLRSPRCDPAIKWPDTRLSPESLAGAIDDFVRSNGVVAVALDGPQGWRDPATPAGNLGWTPMRASVPKPGENRCRPQTYPGSQRRWVESASNCSPCCCRNRSVPWRHKRTASGGYAVLECYPTMTWRAAGLLPLPSKSASRPQALRANNYLRLRIPPVHVNGTTIFRRSSPASRQRDTSEARSSGIMGAPSSRDVVGHDETLRRSHLDKAPLGPGSSTLRDDQSDSGQLLLPASAKNNPAGPRDPGGY